MTNEEKVKNTPLNERPLIQVNQEEPRPMNNNEYADFLKAQEELSKLPKPEPSDKERIAELEAQIAALTAGYEEGVQNA